MANEEVEGFPAKFGLELLSVKGLSSAPYDPDRDRNRGLVPSGFTGRAPPLDFDSGSPQQFRPQALLSTDLEVAPGQAVQWFVLRWQMETTWAEVRAKLGVETQRQWADRAIARTTPCLLALFSVVTLLAKDLHQREKLRLRQAAWYRKPQLTFSDTPAAVRQQLWKCSLFPWSPENQDRWETSRLLFEHFTEVLCYAA